MCVYMYNSKMVFNDTTATHVLNRKYILVHLHVVALPSHDVGKI